MSLRASSATCKSRPPNHETLAAAQRLEFERALRAGGLGEAEALGLLDAAEVPSAARIRLARALHGSPGEREVER